MPWYSEPQSCQFIKLPHTQVAEVAEAPTPPKGPPSIHKVVTRVFPGSVLLLKPGFEAFHDKPLVKTKRGTKWGIN